MQFVLSFILMKLIRCTLIALACIMFVLTAEMWNRVVVDIMKSMERIPWVTSYPGIIILT